MDRHLFSRDAPDRDDPALPTSVQLHLGQLLAAAYARLGDHPNIAHRFADPLAKLDAAFEGIHGVERTDFRNALLALVPVLRRFAISLTRHHSRVDDLVQDTLLRAWRSQANFKPGSNLEAWLFTIMRNQFYSDCRRHSREVEDEDGVHAARMISLPDQAGHLDVSDVQTVLARMAPTMREALVLVAIENLSYEEAAAAMGCRIGTVKSRVWRAREQLVRMLGYTGAEIGNDGVTLAAAGPEGGNTALSFC